MTRCNVWQRFDVLAARIAKAYANMPEKEGMGEIAREVKAARAKPAKRKARKV
jgi:hypothetical protein